MVGGIASSTSSPAVDQVGRPNRQDHDEQRSLTALPGVGRRRGSSTSGRWLLNVHHEEMTKRFHSTRVQIAPCGPLARDGLIQIVAQAGLTLAGVGDDYSEDLMSGLAEASDANYYYVKDTERLPEIFAKELGELVTVAAREV